MIAKRIGTCLLAHLAGALLVAFCGIMTVIVGALITQPLLLSSKTFPIRLITMSAILLLVSFAVFLPFLPITYRMGEITEEE